MGLHDWTHCERSVQTGFGQIHIFYIDFMPAYCWSLLIFISGGSQRKMVKKMQNINTTPERGKKTISIFTSLLCWQAKRPYVNLIIIIQKLNIKIPESTIKKITKDLIIIYTVQLVSMEVGVIFQLFLYRIQTLEDRGPQWARERPGSKNLI